MIKTIYTLIANRKSISRKMAAIYDAMYQTFVDYDEEYAFYNAFIQENNCKTILEIGAERAIWPNDLKTRLYRFGI
jgi:hypothetical protein